MPAPTLAACIFGGLAQTLGTSVAPPSSVSSAGGVGWSWREKDPQDWARSPAPPFQIQTHGVSASSRRRARPVLSPIGHTHPTATELPHRQQGLSPPGAVATVRAVSHHELSHASRDPPRQLGGSPCNTHTQTAPLFQPESPCSSPRPPVGLQRVWPAHPHSRTSRCPVPRVAAMLR